jgi:arylsulfatase A-like enzyme
MAQGEIHSALKQNGERKWIIREVIIMIKHVLALFLSLFAVDVLQAEDKPNIIVFMVDDMGWRDVAVNGSDFYQTPNVDKLAKNGMRFTNAYAACAVCSPTRASYLTGCYPNKTGVTDYIQTSSMFMKLEEVTLAEVLKDNGYKTIHVGKWHLAPLSKSGVNSADYYPERHGFDVNIGGNESGSPGSYYYPFKRKNAKDGSDGPPAIVRDAKEGDYLTDVLTERALEQIEASKDKPFFLSFCHYAVHIPIIPREDLVDKFKKMESKGKVQKNPAYAAMVYSVDISVGKIIDKLEKLNLAKKTMIIFTSDNGGLLGVTEIMGLKGGKGTNYEGGIRVPTIVSFPGVVPPGTVSDYPIHTVDYYPTILAATGAKGDAKHNKEVDGVNLMPVLNGSQKALDRDTLFWYFPHNRPGDRDSHGAVPYSIVRKGDYKLIELHATGDIELYDLAKDQGETTDLSKSMPEKAAELKAVLHKWYADNNVKVSESEKVKTKEGSSKKGKKK